MKALIARLKQPGSNRKNQWHTRAAVTILLGFSATIAANHAPPPLVTPGAIAAEIKLQLAALPTSAALGDLRKAYTARGHYPVWLGSANQNARLQALSKRLNAAYEDGLGSVQFRAPQQPSPDANATALARVELDASRSFLSFVSELHGINPKSIKLRRSPMPRPPALAPELLLARAAVATDLALHLQTIGPKNHFYVGLRGALKHYRGLRASGGWPKWTGHKRLQQGMRHPEVRALRERLFASGDLLADALDSDWYDDDLVTAVNRFQRRNGLEPDGDVGPNTQRALGYTVEQRINQILVNMERARWMGKSLGERFVVINIPGFDLEVREGDQIALAMPVIVGRKKRGTPLYSSEVTRLEFNPYWGIPDSIARKDILPKLKTNPAYLAGMRVYQKGQGYPYTELDRHSVDWESLSATEPFPYYFRQDPGPENALGRVKFLFDNPFDVYMHDTPSAPPSQRLFSRASRAFSSGCIRLEQPIAMAQYLLTSQTGWDKERIQGALDRGKNVRLDLNQPISVHLVYQTVWMDGHGRVQFRQDIYGRDHKLSAFVTAVRFNPAKHVDPQAAL